MPKSELLRKLVNLYNQIQKGEYIIIYSRAVKANALNTIDSAIKELMEGDEDETE